MGKTTMLSSARLLALVASTTFLAAVRAEKCANACYGESCDFWVREWGVSCSLVESEIGCSCAGCACENPDTFEKNIRTFGRRTGTGTGSSTSAPTGAPTSLPGAISISMTVSLAITSAQFTADVQSAFKTGVANSLSNSEITPDHVTINSFSRRNTLSIAFTVETPYTDMSSQSSNINSLSSTLTTQMTSTSTGGFINRFNNAAAAVVSGWTSVAAPTITVAAAIETQAPTAAPTVTTSSTGGASSTATVSILAFAAVLMAFNRA